MAPQGSCTERRAATGEDAPLLGHRLEPGRPSAFTQNIPIARLVVYVLYFLALELGQSLPGTALHQVVEESLCQEMYGRSDAEFCGGDNAVQSALAVLFGWYNTAQLLPGLITAVPYGLLADTYGQKPFIVLSAFGSVIVSAAARIICLFPHIFPIYLICAAPLLYFVGGGSQVCNALLFANVTGLTTDAARSSMFALLVALSYGPRLLATVAASRMIDLYGPWVPLWLSLGFTTLSMLLSFFLVEPKSKKVNSIDATASENGASSSAVGPTTPRIGLLRTKILGGLGAAKAGVSYLVNRCNAFVIRLVACLVIMTLAWQSSGENAQIMRRKFGWTWAKISYLNAMEISISLVSSIILVPAASYIMTTKFQIGTVTRDLTLTRVCGLLFISGAAFIIFAPSSIYALVGVAIWTLGGSYNLFLRNLLVLAVGENSVVLFSCINTVETIGNLAIAPVLAQVFKLGLHWGGVWITLPVMVGCGFAGVGLLLLGIASG